MNAVKKNRGRMAVSATIVAIVLVPLGGCLGNTLRGAGDFIHGAGSLVQGVGQDMALAADGSDQEVARRINETGSARFGNGTNASNATNVGWTGRNR